MVCARSFHRFVAAAAGALLLVCQTAGAAQACLASPAGAGGSAVAEPCAGADHRPAGESGEVQSRCCPALYASAGAAKIDLPQAIGLPAPAPPGRAAAPVGEARPVIAPSQRAQYPPLIILNCCLRN
jgi:hypothetical protein